jgi:hypothetical protein
VSERGTVEIVAQALGELLAPLEGRLATPRDTQQLFSELGLNLPAAYVSGGSFAGKLQTAGRAASELPPKVAALATADALPAVVAATNALLADVTAVINALGSLGGELSASAGSIPGVNAADIAQFAAELPERIVHLLAVDFLDRKHRNALAFMRFFGLVDEVVEQPGGGDLRRPTVVRSTLRLARLTGLASNPLQSVADVYRWGQPSFDYGRLLDALRVLLEAIGRLAYLEPNGQGGLPEVRARDVHIRPRTDLSPPAIELTPLFDLALSQPIQGELAAGLDARALAGATIVASSSVVFQAPLELLVEPPSGSVSGALQLQLRRHAGGPNQPMLLLGVAGGTRLEAHALTLGLDADLAWDPGAGAARAGIGVEAGIEQGKAVLSMGGADGFLTKLLPAGDLGLAIDLGIGYSSARGVYFRGGAGLSTDMHVDLDFGPVKVPALHLALAPKGGGVELEVSATIDARLGVFEAQVQRVGALADVTFPPHGGNLHFANLAFSFKAPSGVGLKVDAGPITGGGFLAFDEPHGEYFGALELTFEGFISLKAIGIVDTRLPDGSKGFSLLILVTAEFVPIQLGFGFTLIGVGGLLGLNRTLDTEALRQGVRTGAVNSILFPRDVVGNVTQIVSDLKSFFPPQEGHVVVAPMGKLGWGTPTLISLELGVILDIPSPALAIIGVLRCILPEEDAPILRLQVAFAGGIDFDKGLIWFDASLFDSGILVYSLSGDMALRIGWRDQPSFVISVGGFHPAFHEIPPDLTGMKRLTIALMSGDNPRLIAQSYFAVTSNTVQNGARVELYAEACGFNVYGYLGYDLLVQFDPFHFVADIGAGLALREGDSEICGIDVSCELSGPTPWRAKGHASLDLWLISVDVGFDVTWGDDAPALPPATVAVDVLDLVATAVAQEHSWRAELPANTSQTVTLRELDPNPNRIVVHPFGVLSVTQKVVPLDFQIDRFGNKKPSADTRFAMTWGGGSTEELREEFAVASFKTLSDDEKLSRKSFEKMKSGLRFATGDASATGATVDKDVAYELSYLHRRRALLIKAGLVKLLKSVFDRFALGGAIVDNAFSVARRAPGANAPAELHIAEPTFHVVAVSDLASRAVAATQAEAFALHDELVQANPALAGTLQVVADHELLAA